MLTIGFDSTAEVKFSVSHDDMNEKTLLRKRNFRVHPVACALGLQVLANRKRYQPDTSLLPVHKRDITEARWTLKSMARALPDINVRS
jgi:hypothetical protein